MKKIFTITLFFFIYILNSTIAKADLNSTIPKADLKSIIPVSENSKQTSEFEKSIIPKSENSMQTSEFEKSINLSDIKQKIDEFPSDPWKIIDDDFYLKQFYSCWKIPPNLPNSDNLIVRVELEVLPDGTVSYPDILDYARINAPGQEYYKVLLESVLRAIKLCQPLKGSALLTSARTTGKPEKVKLNFNANHELEEKLRRERAKKLAEEKKKLAEEKKKLAEEKKIAEDKKRELEELEIAKAVKIFEEEKKRKAAETQKNLNFINKIFENKNLIKLNCFKIDDNTPTDTIYVIDDPHFRIFIDVELLKAVEISPSGKYKILYTVSYNDKYFYLSLHSVKTPSEYLFDGKKSKVKSFYSKEEIITNYYDFYLRGERDRTLNKFIFETYDQEIRNWKLNRHTGISQILPIGIVSVGKLLIKDSAGMPIAFMNLEHYGGTKLNCSKNSF